jgi:hypothetical protein
MEVMEQEQMFHFYRQCKHLDRGIFYTSVDKHSLKDVKVYTYILYTLHIRIGHTCRLFALVEECQRETIAKER